MAWVVIHMDGSTTVCVGSFTVERDANDYAYAININAYLRGEEETAEVVELTAPTNEG